MNPICTTSWCDNPLLKSGLCGRCYVRRARGYDMDVLPRGKVSADAGPEERLRHKGWTVTDSGCWEWNGRRDDKGYGVMALREKRQVFSHRVSYAVWVGELSAEHSVCHKCDNPPCINPEHLFAAPERENKIDMVTKGRSKVAKLTPDNVREIRRTVSLHDDLEIVAKQYGVKREAIRQLLLGNTWTGVK